MTDRTCTIPDCSRPHMARGWCSTHYERWRAHGDPAVGGSVRAFGRTRCSIEGCDRPHRSRGWCITHYQRWRQHGSPEVIGERPAGPDHYNWAGDDVGYGGMHYRLRNQRGLAADWQCGLCAVPAEEWALFNKDSAHVRMGDNGNGYEVPFSTDVDDYLPLCVPCHRTLDADRGEVPDVGPEGRAVGRGTP